MPSPQKPPNPYQRFEFLGDRVLNLMVSRYLYQKYPDYPEGKLTAMLRFTSNDNLEEVVERLPEAFRTELFAFKSRFDYGPQKSNADAVEAYIGKYFLEQGFEATLAWFGHMFAEHIDRFDPDTDYISLLKVYCEQKKIHTPAYKPLRTEKGENNHDVFYFQVFVDSVPGGSGSGSSHARAQKAAAHEALKRLGLVE